MFREDFLTMLKAAKAKVKLFKGNTLGFFLASILAGMFVGFGVLLIFSIGGMMQNLPYTKIVMGASFGVALSLVVIAGAELFTGNNMVMMSGLLNKDVKLLDVLKVWALCWIGNFIGSFLLAGLFYLGGFASGSVGEFIATSSLTAK